MVHRRRPAPVGSRLINAKYTHFSAAVSFGKCPRARTALRIRALTLSIAFVLQMTLRISTSKSLSQIRGMRLREVSAFT